MIMTAGETIDVSDLPETCARQRCAAPRAMPANDGEGGRSRRARCGSSRTAPSVRTWSRKLRENGWNISKTAEVIDTPRSNLYKKLEQYQISQETDG